MRPDWNAAYQAGRNYTPMNEIFLERILHAVGENVSNALDIGCGTGDLARKLSNYGIFVTGIDTSESALEQAQAITSLSGLDDQVDFYHVDIEGDTSQIGAHRFDLVFLKLVLPFILDKQRVIDWIRAHLNPGGAIVMIVPVMAEGYEHDSHVMRISVEADTMGELIIAWRDHGTVDEFHLEYFGETGQEITYIFRT